MITKTWGSAIANNAEEVSIALKSDSKIRDFTEKNYYYWKDEPIIYSALKPLDSKSYKIVELFSGLGGTSMGFEMAGFQTALGVDIHVPSVHTFRKSHQTATAIQGDITKIFSLDNTIGKNLIVDTIKKIDHVKGIDTLIAGIPCQGFSLSNRKRDQLDARNYNFLYFMKAVSLLNPKTVMIENVSGLKTLGSGKFVSHIVEALDLLGYQTNYQIVNAADFGVPQKRQRIVFLGSKIGDKIEFPAPTHKDNHRTVMDAISDLPSLKRGETSRKYTKKTVSEYQSLMRGNEIILKNHTAPSHPDEVVEKIRSTEPGAAMYPKFKQRIRLSWEKPSPTQLSGGIRPQFQFGHPSDARGLTIRERCRIQSIPDWVDVYGGIVQGRVQTGNAVPPLLAKAIAIQIKKHLDKHA